MPPSSKRPQRVRREVNKDIQAPDSSPSRPAKRRRKVEEPSEKPAPEPAQLPQDRAGIQMTDDQLVTALIPYLALPEHFVQASEDHANTLHEKHSKEGVQAYAKLAGKGWTFYVKQLRNNIGRPPEGLNPQPEHRTSPRIDESALPDTEAGRVHIDLGPSKMVSRLHAEIYFDSESEKWAIVVNGRNGIRIDNEPLRRGQTHQLQSGEVIEISGVEMMFVLPEMDGSLKVDPAYLLRAGLIRTDDGTEANDQDHVTSAPTYSSGMRPSSSGHGSSSRGQNGLPGPLPIAPAPPDYKRPGTPTSARSKPPFSTGISPGYANGGTILMNADDVDLSLDSNQHIKPSYSYAQMISQAILDTEEEKLNLNGIYTYIMDKYAYYRHQLGGGWQNSIRHNLSLNKSFHKVARTTDEPGKGMKWCIVPEARDEMAKNCVRGGRGGHRGSSAPGSPGNLGFLTRASRDTPGSAQKRSPSSKSPPLSSYPSNAPQFTPDRGRNLAGSLQDNLPGDGSPLPRHKRPHSAAFGMSDNIPGSPPILSSSYMQEDGNSLVTPAPHRVHPRLAPPSTAQRPSQHMPTSSPAPFWKYADIGNTPLRGPTFDSSPIKPSGNPPAIPASSSPAPLPTASPTRNGTPVKRELTTSVEDLDDENHGFDLVKGFQSIGAYHAPSSNGIAVSGALKSR